MDLPILFKSKPNQKYILKNHEFYLDFLTLSLYVILCLMFFAIEFFFTTINKFTGFATPLLRNRL